MKTLFNLIFLVLIAVSCSKPTQVKISALKCEYKSNPVGLDVAKPRFDWILESAQRGIAQSAYQVLVASNPENLKADKGDVWDSHKIKSHRSIHIVYDGKLLESNKTYYWKVKIWDQDGNLHESDAAWWSTGLFNEYEWKAKWIGIDKAIGEDAPGGPRTILSARMLRHEFILDKKIKSATAFISGLGLYELYLNGEKIGDQVLAPGLTEYNKRSFYNVYDVSKYLQTNQNAIGILLGNGRFLAPRSGGNEQTRSFGFPKAICQILVQYEDGTETQIVTDESWKLTTDGPIRKNNEYDGEYYDARKELKNWSKTGFDDTKWMNATLVAKPGEKLVAQPSEPIKIMDELTPVSVKPLKNGAYIFDMGQNMVGWVALTVKGKSGDKVSMRFAETLNPDGSLFLDNIRTAEVTDTYVLKGEVEEKWEPRFTYHGFRYVEMTGFPGVPTLATLQGKVVHDALEVSGSFNSSNAMLNSIYKNAYWGVRGNYRSMPTDCPQRDERQGWLGDRSAECTGESFMFNIPNLYNKWVTDMNDAQKESGSLPDVAPAYWPTYSDNTTWPGTFLYASEMLYNQYGDLRALETNYPAMQKWIHHMSQYLNDGIMPKDTYGDWCVPPEDLKMINSSDPYRITSAEYIGTSYFHAELKMMKKFAILLGKGEDAVKYGEMAEKVKMAFNNKFLDTTEVRYSNNTCTANILALAFDLVPSQYRSKIVDKLLQKLMGENDSHVGHGIVGGQWLMRTLSETGHADIAWALATQTTYPSWGYMVNKGATTIWELWNGDTGDPGMNSGNHVMLLGDLIIWYYENLAGIKSDPLNPGFKHILMKPQVPGDLTFVDASYQSIHGMIKSSWKVEPNQFNWMVTIPANTTATLYIPTLNREDVLEGSQPVNRSEGVKFIRWEGNKAVCEVKSGSYTFQSAGAKEAQTTAYAKTPYISPADTILCNGQKLRVAISCKDGKAVIRYTTDGSQVSENSPVYAQPFEVERSTTVRAQSFLEGAHPSNQTRETYNYVDPLKNGIKWQLYAGTFKNLPDFKLLKPVKTGNIFTFGLRKIDLPKQGSFALQLYSYLLITDPGTYTFYINSNDGSRLYIDNQLVVDNGGEHGAKEMSGKITLTAGKHAISADYFQSGGGKILTVSYSSDKISYQQIPESVLFKE